MEKPPENELDERLEEDEEELEDRLELEEDEPAKTVWQAKAEMTSATKNLRMEDLL